MLRYFYILVCIQLCFCSIYIDKPEYETRERSVRSKIARSHKKQTRSPKKARLVRFDVQKFMQRPDDVGDYEPNTNTYKNMQTKRGNRRVPENYYGSLVEPYGNVNEKDAVVDYFNADHISGLKTRSSSNKDPSSRHFKLHSFMYEEKNGPKSHNHEKVTSDAPRTQVTEYRQAVSNPEKKCAFRNMKVPFFSCNKSTTKAKRQKKRKMFSFKKHHKVKKPHNQPEETSDNKSDNFNKDSAKEKPHPGVRKISKRSYDQLCPKCIRELINSFKKMTTNAVSQKTKSYDKLSKLTAKEKTTVLKVDNLEDNLQDGTYYVTNERYKRGDEESERERRLQELSEVEKKIENVHVTAPTFSRIPFNIKK